MPCDYNENKMALSLAIPAGICYNRTIAAQGKPLRDVEGEKANE